MAPTKDSLISLAALWERSIPNAIIWFVWVRAFHRSVEWLR